MSAYTSDARGEELVAIQDSNHALPGFNWALSLESLIAYVVRICNSITALIQQ